MPTFVVLGKLTAQAKQNPAAALKARDRVFEEFQKKGLKLTDYSTLGPYDVVLIVEAPSEEATLQFLMAVGATGNLDTTTLRAFSSAELARVRSP